MSRASAPVSTYSVSVSTLTVEEPIRVITGALLSMVKTDEVELFASSLTIRV